MKRSKTSLSQAKICRELGDFWDTHDLSDFWDQTKPVRMAVSLEPEADYYGVKHELSEKLTKAAVKRGISSQTLLNLWLQEKLSTTKS